MSDPPPGPLIRMKAPARKRRYEVLDGLGPDGLPYRPKPSPRRRMALLLSALLCAVMAVLYIVRPDALAAVTLFPVWVWLAPGLLLLLVGVNRATMRPAGAVLLLWLAYTFLLAEEPRTLLRTDPWPSDGWLLATRTGRGLRVLSLNCAGGRPEAAQEVAAYHPNIVLLQEAPARAEVTEIGRRMFGPNAGVAWGPDAAIIADGSVTPLPLPDPVGSYATRARVRLRAGPKVEVVSLRLLPPIVRGDLYMPGAWTAQADNRRARRVQVRALADALRDVPVDTPLIIGGDFNAPQGDAALRPLSPRVHDVFREGGRGWGDTVLNDAPVLRIDQVWASHALQGAAVIARRSDYSDHRLVVCDLWLNR